MLVGFDCTGFGWVILFALFWVLRSETFLCVEDLGCPRDLFGLRADALVQLLDFFCAGWLLRALVVLRLRV